MIDQDQYGPVLIFLGSIFIFYGIINLIIVLWHRHKYKAETATISSCQKYTLKLGSDTNICHAIVLDFVVDQNNYKVRRDIAIEKWAYSERSSPYKVGQQIRIYYNLKNPKDIDLDLRKFYRNSRILCPIFFCMGLICFFLGYYLI